MSSSPECPRHAHARCRALSVQSTRLATRARLTSMSGCLAAGQRPRAHPFSRQRSRRCTLTWPAARQPALVRSPQRQSAGAQPPNPSAASDAPRRGVTTGLPFASSSAAGAMFTSTATSICMRRRHAPFTTSIAGTPTTASAAASQLRPPCRRLRARRVHPACRQPHRRARQSCQAR